MYVAVFGVLMSRAKKVFQVSILVFIAVLAVLAVTWSLTTESRYTVYVLVAIPVYVGGLSLFNYMIKRRLDLDKNVIRSLDLVFSLVWFFILMYIVNQVNVPK